MNETPNTASEHHMDVDLDLGAPPGDEKREGVFFSQKGTPCSRYMPSSFIPKKILKTKKKNESWIFGRVRRFPPSPSPPKENNKTFPELFWLPGTLKLEEKSTWGEPAVGFRTLRTPKNLT